VHEVVAQNMLLIFEGVRTTCPGFLTFPFSNDTLIRVRNAETPSAASAAFDFEIRNRLSRVTYQFPGDIANGIRLISECELWNEIALAQNAAAPTKIVTAKSLKKSLSLIIERRNKIAHEGDLQPTIPRSPWPISRADVSFASDFILNLVRTIDDII
jgi:RiboL-PSP-HEPN